jgi:membrane-associated phospholipid phosphatase
MNILYEIGEFGQFISIILSWILLWNKNELFLYYTVGIIFNFILNIILKIIIQEPRPMFDGKKFLLLKMHKKEYLFQNGIPFEIYGMPSGHAQTVLFSTIFIYLSLKQNNWLYIFLLLSFITCYQRVKYDFHYISQVIVGSIIGSVFGYFMYNFAREKIKGKIKGKPDDNAFI